MAAWAPCPGRREGRISAAPSQLLLSVRAVGYRALSRTGVPRGTSAPVGRLRVRIRIRRRRLQTQRVNISLCQTDEAQEGQKGSIDKGHNQRYSIRGKLCSWQGFRRELFSRRQSWHNFDQHLCWCYSVQADEHLRGHPRLLCRRQRRSNTPLLA